MKKEELYPIQFLSNIHHRLVDCIFGNNLHYVIQSSAVCVDVEVDWLGEIQAEDTHDGLCINYVSAGYKIEIIIELSNIVYERFYLINRI